MRGISPTRNLFVETVPSTRTGPQDPDQCQLPYAQSERSSYSHPSQLRSTCPLLPDSPVLAGATRGYLDAAAPVRDRPRHLAPYQPAIASGSSLQPLTRGRCRLFAPLLLGYPLVPRRTRQGSIHPQKLEICDCEDKSQRIASKR